MQNSLINQDFKRAIKQLRRILPKLSFGLLIGTYLIAAIIMGIFHSQNAPHLGFKIAAFLVPMAIQTGRGTLVFFFQLNPLRIQSQYSMGIIAATILLALSLWEAWLVMLPYGLSWTVSVSTLMGIGWIIEIMILKETMFATQMQLFQNKEQWKELHEFYVARSEFRQFMEDLQEGKRPTLPQLQPAISLNTLKEQVETDNGQAEKITTPLEGNGDSPSLNGQTSL